MLISTFCVKLVFMTKLIFIALISFLVVSCDTNLRQAQNYSQQQKVICQAQSDFSMYATCEERRLRTALNMYRTDWYRLPGADLVDLYFAYLGALDNRYKKGMLDNSEAFLQAYEIKSRVKQDIDRIETLERQRVNQALTGALVGLGMYYDSLNSYNYATGNNATTIYNIQGNNIICTTMNNVVVCN